MKAFSFEVRFQKLEKRGKTLDVLVIAPDEAEAKECIAIAYPDASEIFVGIAFDEMIWPTDWPEERAGKKILGARKYPPEGPTIHPEY